MTLSNLIRNKFLLLFTILAGCQWHGPVIAAIPCIDAVYAPNIATVLIYKKGFEMASPVMQLGAEPGLTLSFDDLDGDLKSYRYTILHCGHDWSLSTDLRESDYLEGYRDGEIREFAYSFNTLISYTHYSLDFPNSDLRPKLSGNYLLVVFTGDTGHPVFTRRFLVNEITPVAVTGDVHQATAMALRNTHQEVDFEVLFNGMNINDPGREIFVVVQQNGRWDNALRGLRPRFTRAGSLDFNYDQENTFPGGNEFRAFDTKSIIYQSERIRSITNDSGITSVVLLDDPWRGTKNYVTDKEINGRKLIKNEEHTTNSDIEADYTLVTFSLPSPVIVPYGNIYILGALTDWQLNENSRMTYDPAAKKYTRRLMLKQGYYNYLYTVVNAKTGVADLSMTEGNHWETENVYTILVYYRPAGELYDRLIAVADIPSIR